MPGDPTKRPGAVWRRLLVILLGIGLTVPLAVLPAAAVTVAGFEIDGDMVSQGDDDWATVGGQPAVTDPVASPSDDSFHGSSPGELDPQGWIVQSAEVSPSATDIGDVYAHGRVVDGEQWAFLGFERASGTGSMLVNIELNQQFNTTNANGVSIPDRQVGDLLIDVTKAGGSPPTVTNVYEWDGSNWVVVPGGASQVESAVNTQAIVDVDGDTIPSGQFGELAINLGPVLGEVTCPGLSFPKVNMRTRSSPQITSQLKDYVVFGEIRVPSGCGELLIGKVDEFGNPLPAPRSRSRRTRFPARAAPSPSRTAEPPTTTRPPTARSCSRRSSPATTP